MVETHFQEVVLMLFQKNEGEEITTMIPQLHKCVGLCTWTWLHERSVIPEVVPRGVSAKVGR